MPTAIALEKKMLTPKKQIKWGDFPEVNAFIPETLPTLISVTLGAPASFAAWNFLSAGSPSLTVLGTTTSLLAGWLLHRFETRTQRNGWVFDEPPQLIRAPTIEATQPVRNTAANWEIVDFLRKRGVLEPEAIVTETRSDQYRIIKIPNYDPQRVESQLPALSMKLGVKQAEMLFVPMFDKGQSAVLVHLPTAEWKTVPFDHSQLQKGELMGFLGSDIRGNAITYHVKHATHILFAGKSGAGKTEAMCNDMESMRRSDTPVEIYIVDPKNTAQLKRQSSTWYTQDIEAGIQKLTALMAVCDARMEKYSAAGCDNFFEYRQKVDPKEPALFFYVDEVAEFLMEDLVEELEEGEHKRHKRALHALQLSTQKQRASGLFMRLGMQHPEAKTLPTRIRNNITARIVCAVEDHHASGVAGVKGAENLPMEGGVIFKYQNRTILGRTAYLK